MASRKVKTQSVDRSKAIICFRRGDELLEAAMESFDQERWSVVGVTAIHAAISLADGLLIQECGLRCTSTNHLELVDLLGHELKNLEDVKRAQKHLRHIISEKNRVEYEARIFSRADAESLVQHLRRFAEWVNAHRKNV